MRYKIISFIIFLLAVDYPEASTLLKVPSAKLSTGDALALRGDTPSCVFVNPALMFVDNLSIEASFNKGFLGDDSFYFLGLAKPYGKSAFGLFLNHYNAGIFEYFDRNGIERNASAQIDYVVGGFYKYQSDENFSAGVSLKYYTSKLADYAQASSFMIDFGYDYRKENLITAVSLRNLGTSLKYISDNENLPLTLACALAVTKDKFLIGCGLNYQINEKIFFPNVAGELKLSDIFLLRGGYKFNNAVESFSLGCGLQFVQEEINLDYNFGLSKIFDNTHFITLSYSPSLK